MKTKYYLLYSLFSSLFGCSTLEDPDVVRVEDTLLILAKNGKTQLNADGADRTIILARLPEEAGIIDVSFTTTGGIFIYSNAKSVKELADSVAGNYRFARAVLQADAIQANESPKQIYVTAEVAKARSRLMIIFTK